VWKVYWEGSWSRVHDVKHYCEQSCQRQSSQIYRFSPFHSVERIVERTARSPDDGTLSLLRHTSYSTLGWKYELVPIYHTSKILIQENSFFEKVSFTKTNPKIYKKKSLSNSLLSLSNTKYIDFKKIDNWKKVFV